MTPRVQITGLPGAEAARRRATAQLTAMLAPHRASSVQVIVGDENGPKGGVAVRCAITVSLAGRGRVHVEEHATTPRLALDGALARLRRRLERRRGSDRDSRRRPKKYYAAERVLATPRAARGRAALS
jgi:ribosome-associated translation inhibitor RaiA